MLCFHAKLKYFPDKKSSNLSKALNFVDQNILKNASTSTKLVQNINFIIVASDKSSFTSEERDNLIEVSNNLSEAGKFIICIFYDFYLYYSYND